MKKYNLKKIMSDAHILYNYLKKQGYSFGECLKRIWSSAKNGSSLTYLTCYKPANYNDLSTSASAYYNPNSTGKFGAHYVGD